MNIRIIATPPGEAPIEVRRAWVGLILPLVPGYSEPVETLTCGVLTGPRHWLGRLWWLLTDRFDPIRGYAVPVDEALVLLAGASPSAAAWWRENTPHLIGAGRTFGFPAEVCEEV
jgi:hypothetical protein